MICYVCQKEINPESFFIRLDSEHIRHNKCSPMSQNFKKAFPKAWTNKYVEKEEIEEPIKYRRLLRLKGDQNETS
jgi:hypothetical protein